jgi:RNA polymerase sigma-70 factor (ECF subfamily)
MHHSWSIIVLTLRGKHIAEITSFLGGEHFATFGLPASLS